MKAELKEEKNMKIKKLLSLMSALAICACMIPVLPVSAVKAETEWNNNRKQADIIAFEDVICGEIGDKDDIDVYKFEPKSDIEAGLTLEDVPEGKRWFIWVMDKDWQPLANAINTKSSYQQLDYKFAAGNTYYIVISPWNKVEDNFGGSYTLYFTPKHEYLADTEIDAEPIDSLKELVKSSDLIATVMAGESHVETIKGTVYTVTELRIMQRIVGDYSEETVEVKVMGGGVADNTLYLTPSVYSNFVEGRPYLVFLKLYDDAPASSLTNGAGYTLTGKALDRYLTADGKTAGFDALSILCADTEYVRTKNGVLNLRNPSGEKYSDIGYKKGEYLGEVEYNPDTMTPDVSMNVIMSNCLPIGTKLWKAELPEGNLPVVIAEVDGERLIFSMEADSNPC